jgi:succinate-semialdehyde dehydrogenase/glutarate-semialdehyde dehydrogenase
MLTRKLGPALAAGCTSVVKPASATPLTAIEICRAVSDAGAPSGVVNLVTSRDSGMVAGELMRDARVRKISFTGSTEVGRELIRRSADGIKRLSLELGGHAPFIVFDDADPSDAADQLVASKFRNAGQTCSTGSLPSSGRPWRLGWPVWSWDPERGRASRSAH